MVGLRNVLALRAEGSPVNSAIVMACAEGIVMSHDSNMLRINSGHVLFTMYWADGFCQKEI